MPKENRPEFAGTLRERIRVERRIAERDGAGSASTEIETIGEYWVAAIPTGSASREQAESRSAMPTWRFDLRLTRKILPGDYIVWNDYRLVVRAVTAEFRPDRKTLIQAEETR